MNKKNGKKFPVNDAMYDKKSINQVKQFIDRKKNQHSDRHFTMIFS